MASPLLENALINWVDQVKEGHNPFGQLPEKKIQEMYALAYVLYQNQRYLEASHFFRSLAMARPSEAKYWKSFGASLQMLKDYDGALNCYLCCAELTSADHPDPYLYVHAADCYLALKQIDAAFKTLTAAAACAKKTNNSQVLHHVALMRQLWSK